MILGAFFYGYLCTQLAGGVLAEKFGGRLVIFSALCLLSICTALAPILAEISLWAFIGGRIALGLASVSNLFLKLLILIINRFSGSSLSCNS